MKPEFFSENKKKQFLSKLNIPEVSSKGSLFFFLKYMYNKPFKATLLRFQVKKQENEPISPPTGKCALEMAF